MANVVSTEQVARALNITPRRVQQLAKDGLPQIARGKFELGACMLWYIRHLQSALQRRSTQTDDGTVTSLVAERTIHAREKNEAVRMANLKARGEVVLIESFRPLWVSVFQMLTQELSALGARLGIDEKQQAAIDAEVHAVVSRFSDRAEALIGRRAGHAPRDPRGATKAKPNAKRVGGSVPSPAAG